MGWFKRRRAMNLAGAVDRIRPSIVQIAFQASGLPQELKKRLGRTIVRSCLGTGFFVNSDGYVATARHVVELGRRLLRQIPASRKGVYAGLAMPNTENMRGNFCVVGFDLVDEDQRHDLALLKLKKNPFRGEVRSGIKVGGVDIPLVVATVAFNLKRPRDGDAVGISGYPLGQPVLVTSAGWMATSWSFEITEIQVPGASEGFRAPDIADVFLADVEVNPGNSGGPVYLRENASVIGVCVASMPSPVRDQEDKGVTLCGRELVYSSGLTNVVPAQYVVDLLKKHGLTWLDK